jgi:hypothetical protein
MFCLCNKLHHFSFNGALIIAMRPEDERRFLTAGMLLFILQSNAPQQKFHNFLIAL